MILGIGAGDRPLLALGMKPSPLASLRASIAAIRELWSGAHVSVEDRAFSLHDAHLRFARASGHPGVHLRERTEDARAGGRGRGRRDPARRAVPRSARVGAGARRPRSGERREDTPARRGVRLRRDRRRRGCGDGVGALDRRVVPADGAGDLRAGRRPRRRSSRRSARATRAGSSRRRRRRRGCCRTTSCDRWRSPATRRTRAAGSRRRSTPARTRSTCSRSARTAWTRSRRSPGASPMSWEEGCGDELARHLAAPRRDRAWRRPGVRGRDDDVPGRAHARRARTGLPRADVSGGRRVRADARGRGRRVGAAVPGPTRARAASRGVRGRRDRRRARRPGRDAACR